jgi:cation diffusion facilitator family transporter
MTAATRSLSRFVWLSIAAAVVTISMKGTAALLTGSVGLMSDAAESVVNLVAAVVALIAIKVSEKPEEPEHAYGHGKAEYLSAGVEGTLIVIAAITIGVTAIERLINPVGLEDLGIGLVITTGASLINLGVALVLLRVGRREGSITLEADGKHLMTDVWTSAGVLAGIVLVAISGWDVVDPLIAIGVAVNIVVAGYKLVRRSVQGLLDVAVPPETRGAIDAVLSSFTSHDVQFHAVRTRQAGRRAFVAMHVLVPGAWTVQQGHDLLERVEADIRAAVPGIAVDTHLEPLEDPASFADEALDRRSLPPSAGPGSRVTGKGSSGTRLPAPDGP